MASFLLERTGWSWKMEINFVDKNIYSKSSQVLDELGRIGETFGRQGAVLI